MSDNETPDNTPKPDNVTPPQTAPGPASGADNASADGAPPKEERNLGMACHLLALAGLVLPLGNIIGPLIMWLVKREESAFVDEQGKEALNFNITIAIAGFVSFLLTFVVIGALLLPAVFIFWIVMTIIAAVKASGGEHYRYPLTLRLIN
ncbi:DUF4870 domain-containing protein [Alloalcanivorax sp. C16-2]|uniref:DUF4870 domain-containing protein n=1 Tax=Alloalcanivorax TaxID=3020832 RepID=UPI001933397A|nr:DUF4870 domain-containing protein [Alloalcanivorax marinus]MBL7249278.1 DUF4870 domain-containing protein [Alloalcanivorax marinus]